MAGASVQTTSVYGCVHAAAAGAMGAAPREAIVVVKRPPKCPVHRVPLELRESRFGPFHGCPRWPDCDITAGVHRDGRLMSTPADAETRAARVRAHQVFDQLWLHADEGSGVWRQPEPERTRAIRQLRKEARTRAYQWLAKELGIPVEECHIGMMDAETCERVVRAVEKRIAARSLP